mmetsp:Transcript_7600/g.20605  ORF Transcript_7600/g.20605 Transcript_7600/m.20605 type:complete len:241 (-) Transcript_7600:76-798(-)|eukprot:CAMPEP_0171206548 /NCGR_PEP_ID=MMETSP0790-20130122/27120_1 /TAXON_ID=2925 /ORGANISM="Alexandrium catenella, Strain OF101" /LENGTH=240 /DNA_ID=CAMNT_0011672097 /DNA_START=150 /DNA_END=872 /DNA_ORIENTATION=+
MLRGSSNAAAHGFESRIAEKLLQPLIRVLRQVLVQAPEPVVVAAVMVRVAEVARVVHLATPSAKVPAAPPPAVTAALEVEALLTSPVASHTDTHAADPRGNSQLHQGQGSRARGQHLAQLGRVLQLQRAGDQHLLGNTHADGFADALLDSPHLARLGHRHCAETSREAVDVESSDAHSFDPRLQLTGLLLKRLMTVLCKDEFHAGPLLGIAVPLIGRLHHTLTTAAGWLYGQRKTREFLT